MFLNKFAQRRSFTVFLLLVMSFSMIVGLIEPPSASAASGVDLDSFYDNFDDNLIDTALWGVGWFSSTDTQVVVSETGGQLVVTPRVNVTGYHYNGLMSSRTYNLTQGSIFVEVVESTQGQANTQLVFGTDTSNVAVMQTENGSLQMKLLISGSTIGNVSIPYDGVTQRWWRIRHVTADNTLRFDTSPNGLEWTQRHSIARGSLNITAGKVGLGAGTRSVVANPGRAVFNNLSWHPLVPNKGDWSSEVTAISPNPTPGTWDHILWGAASPSTMVKFNGTYFLYYIGAEGETGEPLYEAAHRALGVATSADGILFTKYNSNPILTYTTTSGAAAEEGIGSATAIVVGNTIHLYYAAIRSIGGGMVDLDIRYRSSTNGYTFTNDTLIYRSSGNEYSPLGVIYNGSTWSVYIKGPLMDGKGALSRLSGTSPTNLPNKTSVTATTFGSGGNANPIVSNLFVMHFDRREPTEDRFQVRVLNQNAPDTLSEPLFAYTFGSAYGDYATPATFRDTDTGKWFMYTLKLSVDPAVISVRTYMPSSNTSPTATPLKTSTVTLTPSMTFTALTTLTNTATTLVTTTKTATPAISNTPTRTVTSTPGASAGIHIGDIDGYSTPYGQGWAAGVRVFVHNNNHQPVANAKVTGTWSNGYSGSGSCTTDATGSCTIVVPTVFSGNTPVTFTIASVSHATLPYLPGSNHDPDGDSNGLTITIQRP